MIVGVLRADLRLGGTQSLKDKRRIVKSLLERAHREFRVAAAEVDYQENHRRAALGFACVSPAAHHANQVLSHVVTLIERETEADLIDYSIEVL